MVITKHAHCKSDCMSCVYLIKTEKIRQSVVSCEEANKTLSNPSLSLSLFWQVRVLTLHNISVKALKYVAWEVTGHLVRKARDHPARQKISKYWQTLTFYGDFLP